MKSNKFNKPKFYSDVNLLQPKAYSDYENFAINWG